MNDGLEVDFLRRNKRKALGEVKTHLMAEDADGSRSRPVFLSNAFAKNALHEIVVLLHAVKLKKPPRFEKAFE